MTPNHRELTPLRQEMKDIPLNLGNMKSTSWSLLTPDGRHGLMQ
jgi:hypothetical protein